MVLRTFSWLEIASHDRSMVSRIRTEGHRVNREVVNSSLFSSWSTFPQSHFSIAATWAFLCCEKTSEWPPSVGHIDGMATTFLRIENAKAPGRNGAKSSSQQLSSILGVIASWRWMTMHKLDCIFGCRFEQEVLRKQSGDQRLLCSLRFLLFQ